MVVQQDIHTCICQRVSLYHIVGHYEIRTCHRTKLHEFTMLVKRNFSTILSFIAYFLSHNNMTDQSVYKI